MAQPAGEIKNEESFICELQDLTKESSLRKSVVPKLLVAYLSFVLYLYLASWLAYLQIAYLPFWSLPAGSLLPLVLLGVVAVTLYNSWRKRRTKLDDKSPSQKS